MLGTLVPLGLVIALSPITVIPAVLVLQAPRPRPTGLAFLGGWVLGLANNFGLDGRQGGPRRWLGYQYVK